MPEANCEINRDELESSLNSMQGIIDYVFELMKIFYDIFSGKLLADLLREKLGKN